MTTWLLPSKSGQIYQTASGTIYTGTLGVPVAFEDADATGALNNGWSRSSTSIAIPDYRFPTQPLSVSSVSSNGVPSILAPAGTWNNTTGSLTLGTALPFTPSGIVRIALFASGISTQGLYYATFSSTTACQVYTDSAATIQIASTAGAYTPTLATDITLATWTMAGGSMGANGACRTTAYFDIPSTANSKTFRVRGNGVNISGMGGATSTTATGFGAVLYNKNSQTINTAFNGNSSFLPNGAAGSSLAVNINTAADVTMSLTGAIATATTEFIILSNYIFEVLPNP